MVLQRHQVELHEIPDQPKGSADLSLESADVTLQYGGPNCGRTEEIRVDDDDDNDNDEDDDNHDNDDDDNNDKDHDDDDNDEDDNDDDDEGNYNNNDSKNSHDIIHRVFV